MINDEFPPIDSVKSLSTNKTPLHVDDVFPIMFVMMNW